MIRAWVNTVIDTERGRGGHIDTARGRGAMNRAWGFAIVTKESIGLPRKPVSFTLHDHLLVLLSS